MAEFEIDPRILAASQPLVSLTLSEARLQDDSRWPWIVLVPRKPGAREIEHLTSGARSLLIEEIAAASAAARAVAAALGRPIEKLNVGALGNQVPQLHVHIVGRRADDPAWPGPVWGVGQAEPYPPRQLATARDAAEAPFSGIRRK